MVLGTYTFARLPGGMTMIRAEKPIASVQTYSSVAAFTWDASIIGKRILLSWNAMPSAQFDSLDTIYQTGAVVVFNPTDYIGTATYNVEVLSLNGEYWAGIAEHRINCEMELLIMSIVT